MSYYGDPYYYGSAFANHSSLMTGTGRVYSPLRFAPHLSTIAESSLSTYRRYAPPVLPRSKRIIDTADIDVSSPRPLHSDHSRPGNRLRRDRPTIRIRSQALKNNPALREHNERHEKTVGELLKEKFLIKDKKPEEAPKPRVWRQVSLLPDTTEQEETPQCKLMRRMTRRRSSADIQMDPGQLERELAIAQVQAEVLDNLVAEEQAEIEVEHRRATLIHKNPRKIRNSIAESDSDDDKSEETKKKIPKKLKKRKKTTDKPSPPKEFNKAEGKVFKIEASNSVGDFSTILVASKDNEKLDEQFRESIHLPPPPQPTKKETTEEEVVVLPIKKPYVLDNSRNSAYLTLKHPQIPKSRDERTNQRALRSEVINNKPSKVANNQSKDTLVSKHAKITSNSTDNVEVVEAFEKTHNKTSTIDSQAIELVSNKRGDSLIGIVNENSMIVDDKRDCVCDPLNTDKIAEAIVESQQGEADKLQTVINDNCKSLKKTDNVLSGKNDSERIEDRQSTDVEESVVDFWESSRTSARDTKVKNKIDNRVAKDFFPKKEEISAKQSITDNVKKGEEKLKTTTDILKPSFLKTKTLNKIKSDEKSEVSQESKSVGTIQPPKELPQVEIGDNKTFIESIVNKSKSEEKVSKSEEAASKSNTEETPFVSAVEERPKDKPLNQLKHSSADSGIGSMDFDMKSPEKLPKKKLLNSKGSSFELDEEAKPKLLGKSETDKTPVKKVKKKITSSKTLPLELIDDGSKDIILTRVKAKPKLDKPKKKSKSPPKKLEPVSLPPLKEDEKSDQEVDFWSQIVSSEPAKVERPKLTLKTQSLDVKMIKDEPPKQTPGLKLSLKIPSPTVKTTKDDAKANTGVIIQVDKSALKKIENDENNKKEDEPTACALPEAIFDNKLSSENSFSAERNFESCKANETKVVLLSQVDETVPGSDSLITQPAEKSLEKSNNCSVKKSNNLDVPIHHMKKTPKIKEKSGSFRRKSINDIDREFKNAEDSIREVEKLAASEVLKESSKSEVTDEFDVKKDIIIDEVKANDDSESSQASTPVSEISLPLINVELPEKTIDDEDEDEDEDDEPVTPTNELVSLSKWDNKPDLTILDSKDVPSSSTGNEVAESTPKVSKKKLSRRKKSVSEDTVIRRVPEKLVLEVKPKKSPENRPNDLTKMFYTTPSLLLTATPRDLSKVHRGKKKKKSTRTASGSSDSTGSTSSQSGASSRSNSTEVEDDAGQKRISSTRSNDSGFDGSPRLSTPSQSSDNQRNSDSSDHVHGSSGRITPPATNLPRFKKYTVEDFQFLKVLGKGSFGKVLLAELRGTDCVYAVKCLKKDVVLEDDDVECTLIERKVLTLATRHPYLCHLFCTFQTQSHLFFVMEYLNGGDLMFHIQKSGRFPEFRARFYAAEIWSGLNFLHKKGIVYRDLKLDNVLLDFDGHIRIADFGMCKLQMFLDRTADTFCGTPDYMAPEIIKGLKYNQAVDWWSFGVLLYEMLTGQSPFSGCDEDELFWSICNERPLIPRYLGTEAVDILVSLLEKDAGKRPMGHEIQAHGFFHSLSWDRLERRQLDPPFKPALEHTLDTRYFDTAFTAEKAKLTPVPEQILNSIDQGVFHGFSYTNPNATD